MKGCAFEGEAPHARIAMANAMGIPARPAADPSSLMGAFSAEIAANSSLRWHAPRFVRPSGL
jgi:hypothetical protein